MSTHPTHDHHEHIHGADCGHTAVLHGDHTDYLHDGHQHRMHDGHVDECENPGTCTNGHACADHAADHIHGDGCGHEAVQHGDHMDYLVSGHLHHPHGGHCDDHGSVIA